MLSGPNNDLTYCDFQVPVHNLIEQRSIGFIDYEFNIRSKLNLESASEKMVIKRVLTFLKSLSQEILNWFANKQN